MISRKKFISLSSFGFVSTLLPIHEVRALSFILDLPSQPTKGSSNYNDAIEKAKEARAAFLKRDYRRAEALYIECVKIAPNDIRFYDGLQNVYGRQNKVLKIVELYGNGLEINRENIAFYDRAARSLMRLELGYRKQSTEYKKKIGSDYLLKDAEELYLRAIRIGKKPYLQIGLEKVKRKIEKNATEIDYRKDKREKEEKRLRRISHQQRYKGFTNEQLLTRIETINKKARAKLYLKEDIDYRAVNIQKEKKYIYRLIAERYNKNRDFKNTLSYYNQIWSLDKNDTAIKNRLKTLFKVNGKYDELVDFKRECLENKNTIYGNLGLMWALNLRYLKKTGNHEDLQESISIGESLHKNWSLMPHLRIKVADKLAESYGFRGHYNNAFQLIENQLEELRTNSAGMINKLIYRYARLLLDSGKSGQAEVFLKLNLNYPEALVDFPEFNFLETAISIKEKGKLNSELRLHYLLYEVLVAEGKNHEAAKKLSEILEINPTDKFALKRI